MKLKMKILFGVLFFFIFSSLSVQVLNQENFVLGGTIGFSATDSKVSIKTNTLDQKGEGPSAFQLSFAPNVGYFIIDNLAIGMGLDYTFSRV